MVDVKNKQCEHPGCNTRPNFNKAGETNARFCAEHKEPGMVNVKDKQCEHLGCSKQPAFNKAGETKARFCTEHKEPGMVDVKHKQCEQPGCSKIPVFNKAGETKARFCTEHKEPCMVNVKNKQCEHPGCSKIPTFNNVGETKTRFCREHKEPNMVNVKHKQCEQPGCSKIPVFNKAGETKARFCTEHKEPGMVDVKSKQCEHTGCSKQPTFNKAGETKGRFCTEHKEPCMVDVKNKQCEHPGCLIGAIYGFPSLSFSSCASHKQPGMIQYPNRRCSHSRCSEIGTHEHEGNRFCDAHAPSNAINFALQTCSKCQLQEIIYNRADNLCKNCDPVQIQRATKAKELAVKAILDVANINYSHDRTVDGSDCGKERPDFVIYTATHHVIVLEVDENQHKSYPCVCEQNRMVNLSQAFGGQPVIFMRYNPDDYKNHKGHKTNDSNATRHDVLLRWIDYCQRPENSPTEMGALCIALYLFYDGYNPSAPEWVTITKCS